MRGRVREEGEGGVNGPDHESHDAQLEQPVQYSDLLVSDVHYLGRVVLKDSGGEDAPHPLALGHYRTAVTITISIIIAIVARVI